MVFIGPHESHLMIEKENVQVKVNKRQMLSVPYVLKILPPIEVHSCIAQINQESEVLKICNDIHQLIQNEIQKEIGNRPLLKLAKRVQTKYGK